MTIRFPAQNKLLLLIPIFLLLASCAAGDAQFTEEAPAGFWYGLWHGVISVLALIIHIFNDSVAVYEVNNSGGWYDFGFLLGIICVWGGSSQAHCKTKREKKREQEWEEIGDKVEAKVMRKLKEWVKDEETGAGKGDGKDDWEEIGDKVEKKLKRKIREWAEKD